MKKTVSLFLTFILVFSLSLPCLRVGATSSKVGVGEVKVSSGRLNVRSGAGTNYSVLTSLVNKTALTLSSKSGEWWRVEYEKGRFGYCHEDYIRTLSSEVLEIKLSSGSLNVRSGGGTGHSVIGKLYNGNTVVSLGKTNGWYKILFDGSRIGFINENYVKIKNYSSMNLSVPSYKQTDKRWSGVYIGSSGKTIGQIGCVTTGIAMIESYREGRFIYPDAMSKRLSYSSSGNVYWPSDYKAVTSKNGYLDKIYELIMNGKPVLIGAKNSSGNQHWVVVTGYKGGSTLDASGFIINDPGANRATLSQFYSSYPNFYKFFYY